LKSNPHIVIVVGEVSGDKLGASLMKQLSKTYPLARYSGIGGDEMLALGLEPEYPIERLSIMGIGAILKRLPELLSVRKKLAKLWGEQQRPDCFIGIDAPEFNIGLELKLKQHGIKTIHYVSPSIWAWRPSRIHKIKRAVDHMLTLFPFENAVYEKNGVAVSCVGHPMANDIPQQYDQAAIRKKLGLSQDKKIVAILPGSRGSELKFLAPLFAEAANQLYQCDPQLEFVSALANDKCANLLNQVLIKYPRLPITLINKQSREVMMAADVVLLASGTATLEAALLKKPMVVSYKVSTISYYVFTWLSVLTHYALPNLLVSKPFIDEFLQQQATPKNLAQGILKLLNATNQQRQDLNQKYQKLHQSLQLGGSEKAASVVVNMIESETKQ
jgi:lipid-A-disaccharide synthase